MIVYHMSPPGYAVSRSFEGRSLKAYKDPVGIWTIGYGATNAVKDVLGFEIKAGVTITNEQAERLLVATVERKFEPGVRKALGDKATQRSMDAGTDFHYNTGAIGKASWVKSFVADKLGLVRAGLLQWNKAQGKVLPGLTRRREREASIILKGDYGPEGAKAHPLPSVPAAQTPDAHGASQVAPGETPVASGTLRPWHERMESILGLYEFTGGKDNPCILQMAQQCGGTIAKTYKHDSTAWCALTVNWCLITTGHKGTGTLWALDFRKLPALAGPCVGAIATKTRDKGGHVFVVRGRTADGKLVGTGGNQADMVCDEVFDAHVCQFNWPAGVAVPAKVGLESLPVVVPRPHAHKSFEHLPDHPSIQVSTVPAHLDDSPAMLKRGDKDPEVEELHESLKDVYPKVVKDGAEFGKNTETAVKDFQTRHPQLEVTGVADPATRAALQRDKDAKVKLKSTTGGAAGTQVVTGATDAATGGHVSGYVYLALGIAFTVSLAYLAWHYRDEIRAMFRSKFKKEDHPMSDTPLAVDVPRTEAPAPAVVATAPSTSTEDRLAHLEALLLADLERKVAPTGSTGKVGAGLGWMVTGVKDALGYVNKALSGLRTLLFFGSTGLLAMASEFQVAGVNVTDAAQWALNALGMQAKVTPEKLMIFMAVGGIALRWVTKSPLFTKKADESEGK